MATRSNALMLVGITAVLVSGCSSIMPFGRDEPVARAPTPLAAAPTGSVTGATLPPPAGMQPAGPASGLAALDPSMQGATGTLPAAGSAPAAGGTQVAGVAAPGVSVGRTDLLGGWKISSAGDSCQLFMTLTTWAGGYRASTRGCATPPLQTISAWNMEGPQVQLLNDSGATVARLYPSSRTEFSGQSEGGGPVTVTR